MPLGDSASITCVIPTHRRGGFLREAIQSAQDQTTPPSEIIVVSDVEDPIAESICDAFSGTAASPVRYFERRGGVNGASGSRNFGAEKVTSELVAFLDDDDKWDAEFLEACQQAIDREGADLAVAWITEFSDEHEKPGHSIKAGLAAADVLAVNPGITGSNFVVRVSRFRDVGGFDVDLPVKNDTDFFARFMRAGGSYSVVNRRLVMQRKHQMGQLTAVNERRARGAELYMAKHRAYLTRADRRELTQLVHRIRSRSSSSRVARVYHAAWVAALYGPLGLLRKIRRGREREVYRVEGFRDSN